MTGHVRKADERDVPDIVALWEEFMELLRCTNRHYWKVRTGWFLFGPNRDSARVVRSRADWPNKVSGCF